MSDAESAVFAPRLVFPPGTVVEGKYRIEGPLGQGAMGCVFLATDMRNGENVALKFMHPADPSQGPAAFAAFLHAARAAARFRSENVAHVRDMGMLEDGAPFLVVEFLEGGTLSAMLRARGALPIALAVDIAMQAARGLGEAHAAGVIHRDLRPSNWFLTRRPDGLTLLKLLDFGGSRMIPRPGNTEDRRSPSAGAVGVLPYTAPEQIRSEADVDERADVWSLGVVLYEMLAGVPPFHDETSLPMRERILVGGSVSLRPMRSDVPPDLEAVILRCLERSPDRRFANTDDLILALVPFRATESRSVAPRPSTARPPPVGPVPDDTARPAPREVLTETATDGPAVDARGARHPSIPPEVAAPESVQMAIVSPVAAPSMRSASALALRARPRLPLLLAGGGALLVAVAVASAASTGEFGASSTAQANRAAPVIRANVPLPAPADPSPPAHMPETAPVEPPLVKPQPAPEPPSHLPRPAVRSNVAAPEAPIAKSAPREQSAAKVSPSGEPPPVGTAGFGERE